MAKGGLDYIRASASEMAAAVADRTVSAVELVEAAIARIDAMDSEINAVVARDFDAGLEQARAADEAAARGAKARLLGVPITVKEAHQTARMPTTWGLPEFAGWTASKDSAAVARLKAAGAIVLGKTNVPPLLADWQSDNPIYGRTCNPHALERTAGGSSGGSAAALASGMVPLELGSDTGGSIRVPSHFCGMFGHRPTFGLVPSEGHAPPGVDMEAPVEFTVVGPLARSAADLELALSIVIGAAPPEDIAWTIDLPKCRHTQLRDFRVLVLEQHPVGRVSSDVRAGVRRLADQLANSGARVEKVAAKLPDLEGAMRAFDTMARVPLVMSATRGASSIRSELTAQGWVAGLNARERARAEWRNLFETYDVVLAPLFGRVAFAHDNRPFAQRTLDIDGEITPYADQTAWASIASFAGLPATCVPVQRTASGLPTGVQIIGPRWEDLTTIGLAKLLERELGLAAILPAHDGS